jgi:hypothetical protein
MTTIARRTARVLMVVAPMVLLAVETAGSRLP